jgi:two-component system chemotaxis sensor kinase CheA
MVDLSKYKDIYVSEAKDHLQKLNDNLLALEKKKGGKDILNELMRSSHTIKGSSATMQYEKTAFLAHVMEDIFDYARNDMIKITPEIINKLFKAVDTLEKSVKSVSKKGKVLMIRQ